MVQISHFNTSVYRAIVLPRALGGGHMDKKPNRNREEVDESPDDEPPQVYQTRTPPNSISITHVTAGSFRLK